MMSRYAPMMSASPASTRETSWIRAVVPAGIGARILKAGARPCSQILVSTYNRTPMPRSEPIKAVRGVRDILPRDRPLWRAAERAAADVATRFGYQEIVTPIIEHEELIERVGEDTDAVSKELYRFEDRGGRRIALRPAATAGIVRADSEGVLKQSPRPARLH